MKKISFKRKICALATSMALAVSTMSIGAAAATYDTYLTRGVKYLCWSKDSVVWKTNSKKIVSYDPDQSRSGFFVKLNGIKKEKSRSTSTKYSLLCKHTFMVGAVVKGVTLGWNTDINDRLYINKNGRSSVSWDV